MSRTGSLDAFKDRYQRSRIPIQQQQQNDTKATSLVSTVVEEEEEEEEEQEERASDEEDEEEEEDDYSMYSSSSSIPDENINFDLVYALHTFVATVDGQASVVKGDAMTLLDDSNSYWWLVRALKTSEVGYIPAENIETPFERLARLNKHRNIEVTLLDKIQFYDTNGTNKKPKEKKSVTVSQVKSCQVQLIITDDDHHSFYEEDFEEWEEAVDLTDESDDEAAVIESLTRKTTNKNKFAPVKNPDYNKSPVETKATILEKPVQETPVEKQVEEPVQPVVETQPVQVEKIIEPTPVQVPEEPVVSSPTLPPPVPVHQQQQQGVVSGLKRLLSIGKRTKTATVEPANNSEDTQYHVLRIFSGNINVGAMFSTVAVTPDMNADQLLKLALQKFHIDESNDGIEYYLTVKSMDSDEITLMSQDKPLAIFESLSDHLTTPMPSLTYIKRLSIEQPTIKVTRVGVSKARQRAQARFGEDSFIRFSLHKRIKRTIETNGQIYVKISYFADSKRHHHHLVNMESSTTNKISTMGLIRKSSLLRVDQHVQQQQQLLLQQKAKQERIDKLVAVSTDIKMSDLTSTALEKFHMTDQDHSLYHITLSINGQETMLSPEKTIATVLNDPALIPKGTTEKLFVLRRKVPEEPSRFKRFLAKPEPESSTGSVLRRLDEAIQSLEHDKRQLDKIQQQPVMRRPPTRSNSLSNYHSSVRKVPTRSSSLKISSDVFDTNASSSLSNMDDLQLELTRIVASHSAAVQ